MKERASNFPDRASAAVSECFDDTTFCALRWGPRKTLFGIDRIGRLRIQGVGERTLLLEVKKSGQQITPPAVHCSPDDLIRRFWPEAKTEQVNLEQGSRRAHSAGHKLLLTPADNATCGPLLT